ERPDRPSLRRAVTGRLAGRTLRRVLLLERDRALDARPRPRRRLARIERGRDAPDLAQVVDGRAARRAIGEMPLDLGLRRGVELAVDQLVQDRFVGVHACLTVHLPSSARSFTRALNTCDFDVPSAMPSRAPTSLWSSP